MWILGTYIFPTFCVFSKQVCMHFTIHFVWSIPQEIVRSNFIHNETLTNQIPIFICSEDKLWLVLLVPIHRGTLLFYYLVTTQNSSWKMLQICVLTYLYVITGLEARFGQPGLLLWYQLLRNMSYKKGWTKMVASWVQIRAVWHSYKKVLSRWRGMPFAT